MFVACLLLLLCNVTANEAGASHGLGALSASKELPPDPSAAPRLLPRAAVVQATAPHRKPRSTISGSKKGVGPQTFEVQAVAAYVVFDPAAPVLTCMGRHETYSARAPPVLG
jgi:hypothetical protein